MSYSIEWAPESRKELMLLASPPEALYADINQFWVDALQPFVKDVQDRHSKNVLEVLGPAVRSGKAVKLVGMCLIGKKPVKLVEADVHTSGIPCRDFSNCGTLDGTFTLLCNMFSIGLFCDVLRW
jgi:hypothetical protein